MNESAVRPPDLVEPANPRQQIVALFWKFRDHTAVSGDDLTANMLGELSSLMDELDGRRGGTPSPMRPVELYAAEYPIAKDWAVVNSVQAFQGIMGRRARVKASHWSPDVSKDKIVEGDISVFFDVAECDAPRVGESICVPIFTHRHRPAIAGRAPGPAQEEESWT